MVLLLPQGEILAYWDIILVTERNQEIEKLDNRTYTFIAVRLVEIFPPLTVNVGNLIKLLKNFVRCLSS